MSMTLDKPLSELSDTAIKTRVHWLDRLELVNGRVGISPSSPMGVYHVLAEGSMTAYKPLCSTVNEWNMDVYDSTIAALSDRTLCKRCEVKKRKMLRAARALGEHKE